MSTECRMYQRSLVSVLLLLVWWRCGAGLCEEVSGRHHKLQELLKSLEVDSTKLAGYKAKNASSKLQQLSQLPGRRDMEFLNGPDQQHKVFNPDPSSIKSYQDFYRVFYGSQAGVDHIRKQYGPEGLQEARARFGAVRKDVEDVKRFQEHYLRVLNTTRCRVPRAQIVRVKDYYPDPSREYLPRCTVLHRCGENTGCCDNDADHCVPRAMQEVTLYFYSLSVMNNGRKQMNTEKLLFVNHTACQCQPINDLPRIQESRHPLDGINSVDDKPTSKCRECPVPFNSRTYSDGRCGCDCFDRQRPCLRIKRGREPLSDIERRCVEANHCHIPECEYGLYDHRTGYCPKRHDEAKPPNTSFQNAPHQGGRFSPRTTLSASQRWGFVERD